VFIMDGTGAGVIAGPTLFAVVEAGRGWFFRPALFLGGTLEAESADIYATWAALRIDACGRIPGFYIERHGIQLDLCGGPESGFQHYTPESSFMGTSTAPPTQGFLALGPSAALRGELGNGLALVLRGVGEVNILTESVPVGSTTANPSRFIGRAELGLSWQLR
jgi:hypothetical protein